MTDKHKTDRRIERTRAALRDALLVLVRREEWAEINVRAICHEANVARSSFYLHFDNKADLLDSVFSSGMIDAKKYVQNNSRGDGKYATISWLVEHIYSNLDFFQKGALATDIVSARFRRSIAELLTSELKLYSNEISDEAVYFVVGGIFSTLQNWHLDADKISQEVQCTRLNDLAGRILNNQH